NAVQGDDRCGKDRLGTIDLRDDLAGVAVEYEVVAGHRSDVDELTDSGRRSDVVAVACTARRGERPEFLVRLHVVGGNNTGPVDDDQLFVALDRCRKDRIGAGQG